MSKLSLHDTLPTELPAYSRFPGRRSVVFSAKGMIACSQPIACEAGLEILRSGGNAADAAVAVSAALNVVEPGNCGIGGDAFCLYYDAKTKRVTGLNGSGRSPKALDLPAVRRAGIKGKQIPLLDLNSVTVPGCAAAWEDTIKLLGSGTVTLADALAPAIRMAEEGVPISADSSHYWCASRDAFLTQAGSGHELLINDPVSGELHAPRVGEIFKNPTLARTFRTLAEKGKEGFYGGRIGKAIVELIQSQGGLMTLDDLESHVTEQIKPISINFGGASGVTIHEAPPNGQGITALVALGIIEALEEMGVVCLQDEEHNGTRYLHTLIEVMRIAFADTRAYVADPAANRVPVEQLLSKEYLKTRAALFDLNAASPVVRKGAPFASSDTVLFCTADKEGNTCSYIQSNYWGFGTFAVPDGCGFTLQNRGSNFTLEEGHPNCIAGGKRPYHTIIPSIVTRGDQAGGDVLMAFGVMGGFMQPQGHVQVILNMLQHNCDAQSALDAPRFCISANVPDDQSLGDVGTQVFLEPGIKPEVCESLKAMGHNVSFGPDGYKRGIVFGKGQIIQQRPGGTWAGGSDLRGDGHAVPQI